MIWNRLKNSECPKCKSFLHFFPPNKLYKCVVGCKDFSISEAKFNEVVNNLYKKKKDYVIQTDGILEEDAFERKDLEFNNFLS